MTSRIPLVHTFLKFPVIPAEVFKVIDCFCSVYPGEWDWTHFENCKTSQSAYVWYLHLDLKITSDFLRVFVFALSVIPLDVSALLLPWPGGRNVSKSTERFFTRPYCGKNVWSFCHLPLPDSLLLRSCKKQDIYPRMSCSLLPEGNGILGNCKAETFYELIIGKIQALLMSEGLKWIIFRP